MLQLVAVRVDQDEKSLRKQAHHLLEIVVHCTYQLKRVHSEEVELSIWSLEAVTVVQEASCY